MKHNTDSPDISVVIPCYNSERTLYACLEAICHTQAFSEDRYEVVVVDDGSSDRTAEIARRFPVRYFFQENQGPGVARNRGVHEARGSIILFTDSDCVPEPDWIEEMTKPFDAEEVTAVKGAYVKPEKGMAPRFAQLEFEERYEKLEKSRYIDLVDTYSAAFRKEAFLEVGGFDPNFPVASNEDVDLSYKLAKAGKKMVFNRRALVRHLHRQTLFKYLKMKFLRAYWRIMVYKRFPEKIISDSYTPQSLKFQIFFAFLFFAFLLLAFFIPYFWIPAALAALGFLGFTVRFVLKGLRYDPLIAVLSPGFLFLRSTVFGLGIITAVLSKKRKDLLFPFIFMLTDQAVIFLAFCLAYFLRVWILGGSLPPFAHTFARNYLSYYWAVPIVFLAVFVFQGLYYRSRSLSRMREFIGIARGVSLSVIILMAGSFLIKEDFSRPFMVVFWILLIVMLDFSRYLVRWVQGNFLKKGYNVIRAVIVGSDETGQMVLNKVTKYPQMGYKIIGYVDDEAAGNRAELPQNYPFLGTMDRITRIINKYKVDEIFLAKPEMDHRQILNLLVRCEREGVSFRIISDLFDIVTGDTGLDSFADTPVVDVSVKSTTLVHIFFKRLMDLTLGTFLLLIFSPFMLVMTVWIRRTAGSPALLKEERIGRHGNIFRMYRFRTTPDIPPPGPPGGERKYTPLGLFLVKANLDELPQLLNVIRGEMSLVGPRPEYISIVAEYEEWQRKRLSVKPGITGLWQVVGRKDLVMHRNLEYDFYYIKNQSILLDLLILLKTIPSVAFARGLVS